MKKRVKNKDVYYTVEWSEFFKYDRHTASRILPELPGVLFFSEKKENVLKPILCFASWREGLRSGVKDLFDPLFSKYPGTSKDMLEMNLYFRYCIVDSSQEDLQDVLFWMIANYNPLLNSIKKFPDSKRYKDIYIDELKLKIPNK